jgi:hypothetical protein
VRQPGPVESVAQEAIRFIIDDEVAQRTSLGVVIAGSVSQLLRESRIQHHQDGEKTSLMATPQFPSLSALCVTALEQSNLNKALRRELYDILAQVELPPGMAERILRVQAANQERAGVGDVRSDITEPTALHFYSVLRKEIASDPSNDSGFLLEQMQIGEALLARLTTTDDQAL